VGDELLQNEIAGSRQEDHQKYWQRIQKKLQDALLQARPD